MHLTEEPPLPKGYPRTSITKAQREELLADLRRRYRERKTQTAGGEECKPSANTPK